MLHMDGHMDTDMMKLIVGCHSFANAPEHGKKQEVWSVSQF